MHRVALVVLDYFASKAQSSEISHKFSTRNFLSSHSFTISGDAPRKMSPNKRDWLYVKGGVTWEEGERGGL